MVPASSSKPMAKECLGSRSNRLVVLGYLDSSHNSNNKVQALGYSVNNSSLVGSQD